MPYKFETNKLTIPRELNKNVKLSLYQRKQIKKEYKPFINGYQTLAKKYGVSKRLIIFIVNPEKEQLNKERQKEKCYYNKEKNKTYIKKHRSYKYKLYKEGKLQNEN